MKMKASTSILVVLIAAAGFFLTSCKRDSPAGPNTPPSDSFASVTGTIHLQTSEVTQPLSNAEVRLDTLFAVSDSSGRFTFTHVYFGTHMLAVSYSTFIRIDTSVVISSVEESIDIFIPMYQFGGGLYRTRIDSDPVDPNVTILPDYLKPLVPLRAVMTLDEEHTRQSDSAWSCSFNFGNVVAGRHTLHVDSTAISASLDTSFTVDHDGSCGIPNYYFVVRTIPPPSREFVLPITPGASWQYEYSYRYVYSPYQYYMDIRGTHDWSVVSVSQTGDTRSLLIGDVRRDSVHITSLAPETTYVTRDTVQFTITQTGSTITLPFPKRLLPARFQSLARFHTYGMDTLVLSTNVYDIPVHGSCTYISGVGLAGFSVSQASNSYYVESMTLVSFSP